MAEAKKNTKTVEMPNGKVIDLPPIELAPDEFFTAARNEDHSGMAMALIGLENYHLWTGAGGNALALLTMYAKVYDVKLPNL